MVAGMAPYLLGRLASPFVYGPNDNAEVVPLSVALPAGVLVPGALVRLRAGGRMTSAAGAPALDIRWRIGPVTLTGAILGQHHEANNPVADTTLRMWAANNQTDKGWWIELGATVQPNGTDVVCSGVMTSALNNQVQFAVVLVEEATVASVNPAIDNLLEFTLDIDKLAANIVTMTFGQVSLESGN